MNESLFTHEDAYFYEILCSEAFKRCGYTLNQLKWEYTLEDLERMKLYNDFYIDQKNSWQPKPSERSR